MFGHLNYALGSSDSVSALWKRHLPSLHYISISLRFLLTALMRFVNLHKLSPSPWVGQCLEPWLKRIRSIELALRAEYKTHQFSRHCVAIFHLSPLIIWSWRLITEIFSPTHVEPHARSTVFFIFLNGVTWMCVFPCFLSQINIGRRRF